MLTVRDFLNKGFLPWYRVLSGEEEIDTRVIEFVSVNEPPSVDDPIVGNFIRKNEMVLSDAIGCENEDIFLKFVRGVDEAKASALILAQQENEIVLPPKVKSYLSRHPLPVILVPWQCYYGDVLKAVLDLLRMDTLDNYSRYESLQRLLLKEYLVDKDLNCAAALLAEELRCKVLIFDTTGCCKGRSSHFFNKNNGEIEACYEDKEKTIDIKTNDRSYGCVYVDPLPCAEHFDSTLFGNYLIWPLILWFNRERIIRVASQTAKDDFVWRLTKSSPEDFENLYEEGTRLGFYLRGSYTCITGGIHFIDNGDESFDERRIVTNINFLKEEILRTAHRCKWYCMVTYQQNRLILYLQCQQSDENSTINFFLDTLEESLSETFPQMRFTWGISNPGRNPTDFRKCFQDAKLAQELCVDSPAKNARFTFKNTIVFNAVSLLTADQAMWESLRGIIAPLYEYDAATGMNLIKTLQCYLECKNISEAARLLYIHRHSLIYRLSKIEELTGLSLKNSDNFFLLELCVRMFKDNYASFSCNDIDTVD